MDRYYQNRESAEIMEFVFRIIPGGEQEQHDARCRIALAVHRGESVIDALEREGVT